MNKLLKSIACVATGLAMAIGVGAGLGREAKANYAADAVTVSQNSFAEISGYVNNDENVYFEAQKGAAQTAPAINSNEIRIYQNGGLLVVSPKNGSTINSITIGSSMETTVQVSVDDGSYSGNNAIEADGNYTVNNLSAKKSVTFKCTGTDKSHRLYLNTLSVTYIPGEGEVPSNDPYVLDGTITGGNAGYADESSINQNDIDWKVMGNTTMNPWRFGGKSLNGVNRTIYSEDPLQPNYSKISFEFGSATSVVVNSITISLYTTAAGAATGGNGYIDQLSVEFGANNIHSAVKEGDTSWANSYYRIVFNITITSSSNQYFQLKSITFTFDDGSVDPAPEIRERTFAETLADGQALAHNAASTVPYKFEGFVTKRVAHNYYLTATKNETLIEGVSDADHGSRDIYTNTIELYNVDKVSGLTEKLLEGAKVEVTMILKNYHGTVEDNGDLTNDAIVVKEVGIPWSAPATNPETVTLAEFIALQNIADKAYDVVAEIKSWSSNNPDQYGNMVLTDGENDLIIYGSSATKTALVWDGCGSYYFNNPKDFLTNDVTSNIEIGDTIVIRMIRADHSGTIQGSGVILNVLAGETVDDYLATATSIKTIRGNAVIENEQVTAVNSIAVRFGVKISEAIWNVLEDNGHNISEYGIKMFLTNTPNSAPTVASRGANVATVSKQVSVSEPDKDGQGNHNFLAVVTIPDELPSGKFGYNSYFCVRPYLVIDGETHWLLDADMKESIVSLAKENDGTNLSPDAINFLKSKEA